jgi:hypothetical protein
MFKFFGSIIRERKFQITQHMMKIRNLEENQTFSNIVMRIVTWGNV